MNASNTTALTFTATDAGFEALGHADTVWTIVKSLGGRYTLYRGDASGLGEKVGKNASKADQIAEANRINDTLAAMDAPAAPTEAEVEVAAPAVEVVAEVAVEAAPADRFFHLFTPETAPAVEVVAEAAPEATTEELTAGEAEAAGLAPKTAAELVHTTVEADTLSGRVLTAEVRYQGHTLHYLVSIADGAVEHVERADGEELPRGLLSALEKALGAANWLRPFDAAPAGDEVFDIADAGTEEAAAPDAEVVEPAPTPEVPAAPVPAPEKAAKPKTTGKPAAPKDTTKPDWKALRAACWARIATEGEGDGVQFIYAHSPLEKDSLHAEIQAGRVKKPVAVEGVEGQWKAELTVTGQKWLAAKNG